jgi:hypothetical protein
VGRHLKDRAYARMAALWPGPLDPREQVQAQQLFHWLVDQETEEGTPLEEIWGRLPKGLAEQIRHDLAAAGRGRGSGN